MRLGKERKRFLFGGGVQTRDGGVRWEPMGGARRDRSAPVCKLDMRAHDFGEGGAEKVWVTKTDRHRCICMKLALDHYVRCEVGAKEGGANGG